MNFAEKMDELEKILKDLEGDSLSLDSALAEYERGVSLVRECRAYLEDAQKKDNDALSGIRRAADGRGGGVT